MSWERRRGQVRGAGDPTTCSGLPVLGRIELLGCMGNSRRLRRSRKQKKEMVSPIRVWAIMVSVFAAMAAFVVALVNTHAPGGDLFPHGYWVGGRGVEDASRVVSPDRFEAPRVREAYRVAQQIPEVLNHVYCWCGCMDDGMRSALECFESDHAADCEVCLRTAEIAWEMVQEGEPHPEAIHKAIDQRMQES